MSFPTMLKAAVVAVALGGTALTAMPVQAAGPSFSLQFGVTDYNNYQSGKFKHDRSKFRWDIRAIQWKLSQTYRHVRFQQAWKGTYIFIGRKGSTWYELRVDARNGHVWAIPIRQKRDGGFNLTFNF